MQYLETLLASIRTADNFWYNLSADQVTRRLESLQSMDEANFPLIILQAGVSGYDDRITGSNIDTFQIFIYGFTKSTDEQFTDRDIERLAGDVMGKIGAYIDFGSLVRTTRFTSVRTDGGVEGMPEYGVMEIELSAEYQYLFASP